MPIRQQQAAQSSTAAGGLIAYPLVVAALRGNSNISTKRVLKRNVTMAYLGAFIVISITSYVLPLLQSVCMQDEVLAEIFAHTQGLKDKAELIQRDSSALVEETRKLRQQRAELSRHNKELFQQLRILRHTLRKNVRQVSNCHNGNGTGLVCSEIELPQ